MEKKEIFFDQRVVEINLREEIITRTGHENFLKALPDRNQKARWVSVEKVALRGYLRKLLAAKKNPSDSLSAPQQRSSTEKQERH